jgi:hypothetical protein
MTIVANSIFQTGQKVPINGIYEVVGVNLVTAKHKKEQALRPLQSGEYFPNYEGWEVCWRFTGNEVPHDYEKVELHS